MWIIILTHFKLPKFEVIFFQNSLYPEQPQTASIKMSKLDGILKKYTDTATGNLHGATFIAIDKKGLVSTTISYLFLKHS